LTKRIPGLDLKKPVHLLAFGFGAGVAPKAPGTWGTLVAVPLFLLMQSLSLPVYLGITLVLALLGVWLCSVAANDLGVHDHPGIVWDEIIGYLITMIAAPAGWLWWVAGFLLFRLFDILKPWPINAIDKGVGGGVGIMLDDVLAGLMALCCLQLLAYFI